MSRLVTEASAAGFENLANLSLREHRILGAYFRLRTKVRRALTRREVPGLMSFFGPYILICPAPVGFSKRCFGISSRAA